MTLTYYGTVVPEALTPDAATPGATVVLSGRGIVDTGRVRVRLTSPKGAMVDVAGTIVPCNFGGSAAGSGVAPGLIRTASVLGSVGGGTGGAASGGGGTNSGGGGSNGTGEGLAVQFALPVPPLPDGFAGPLKVAVALDSGVNFSAELTLGFKAK
ncbi:unnamed protein product [Phaeothamnion confervicola]